MDTEDRESDYDLTEEYLLSDGTCPKCGFAQRRQSMLNVHSQIAAVKQELRQQSELRHQDSVVSRDSILEELGDDDTASVVSVSLNPIEELPMIHNPFPGDGQDKKNYGKWKSPPYLPAEREKQFNWEKPWGVEEKSNDTPAQRARRLELTIEEKERDLEVLRKQYKKAQHENFVLAEEIRSFKGDHYDDLKAENARLKEAYGRVFRENMTLRTKAKLKNNSKINELEEKRKLEEKYGVKPPKRK